MVRYRTLRTIKRSRKPKAGAEMPRARLILPRGCKATELQKHGVVMAGRRDSNRVFGLLDSYDGG